MIYVQKQRFEALTPLRYWITGNSKLRPSGAKAHVHFAEGFRHD